MSGNPDNDVFGIHILALWRMAQAIDPSDPDAVARRILKQSSHEYFLMNDEQLSIILARLNPKNWPSDESD